MPDSTAAALSVADWLAATPAPRSTPARPWWHDPELREEIVGLRRQVHTLEADRAAMFRRMLQLAVAVGALERKMQDLKVSHTPASQHPIAAAIRAQMGVVPPGPAYKDLLAKACGALDLYHSTMLELAGPIQRVKDGF